MNIDKTLERIGYSGPREATLETLRGLHHAFLHSVPFENLDIHIGREIVLDPARIYHKIVEERRGGFCHECNTLFHELLRGLGYTVRRCSARMALGGVLTPPFAHMMLLVELPEGTYLADVGNGESTRDPMRLDGDEEHPSPEGKTYRLGEYEGHRALLWREPGDTVWNPRFVFDPAEQPLEAFAEECRWQQTSPESIFVSGKLVTLALPDGRKNLIGPTLAIARNGQSESREVGTDGAYAACLREEFGITLP